MNENSSTKESKKIFIFDDNLEILELCTEILNDIGFEVRTSPTTNNIKEQVKEFLPNLIFMDNWLPDISGIEATRLIKADEDLKNIPVIIYSTSDYKVDKEISKQLGADYFLTKLTDIYPLPQELVKAMEKVGKD